VLVALAAFLICVCFVGDLRAESVSTPPDLWSIANHPEVATDFDGNGEMDSAVAESADPSTIDVRLAPGTDGVRLTASGRVAALLAVDIDNDGDADLVAFVDDGRIDVWLHTDGDQFVRHGPPEPPFPQAPSRHNDTGGRVLTLCGCTSSGGDLPSSMVLRSASSTGVPCAHDLKAPPPSIGRAITWLAATDPTRGPPDPLLSLR
jgi:hypothetical protein